MHFKARFKETKLQVYIHCFLSTCILLDIRLRKKLGEMDGDLKYNFRKYVKNKNMGIEKE